MSIRKEAGAVVPGLLILAAGIAIGALARPARWSDSRPGTELAHPVQLAANLVRVEDVELPPENGLATLSITLPPESARVLQAVRERSLERGVIVQAPEDTVMGELSFEGVLHPAEFRIKGDWTDHVETERWSLRIRLDEGEVLGMREFSIQAPKTRGYLWEWVIHEAARREGLLAPRATFVNVVQNGHANGIYYLEEHFERELLESQGRGEGPIVLFDESTLWASLLREGNVPSKGLRPLDSVLGEPAHTIASAEVRAYEEKRLSSIPSLNRQLENALAAMNALRALALGEEASAGRYRSLRALDELRGKSIDEIVDGEALGRLHALLSLFQVEHSLVWHNLRFYYDPLKERLEPISFDNNGQEVASREPVPFRATGVAAVFARSTGYSDELFATLGRLTHPDWIGAFFASLEPDLSRFEAALRTGEPLPGGYSVAAMQQRLRAQTLFLRELLAPADPIHFVALREPDERTVEVLAWATTRVPVLLEGFRSSTAYGPTARSSVSSGARASDEGIVLEGDGIPVSFRFPLVGDELDLHARFRTLAAEDSSWKQLDIRERGMSSDVSGPRVLDLGDTLERHPFLEYRADAGELVAAQGTWDVSEDLVLPPGLGLALGAGVTLRFAGDTLLSVEGALVFQGTPERPVVLEAKDPRQPWDGIVVRRAATRSEWDEVIVRGTSGVRRPDGKSSGVTFFRSSATLRSTLFDGTQAGAALSVGGADLLLEACEFRGCAADAFDGEYVTGEIRNCVIDGVLVPTQDAEAFDARGKR